MLSIITINTAIKTCVHVLTHNVHSEPHNPSVYMGGINPSSQVSEMLKFAAPVDFGNLDFHP